MGRFVPISVTTNLAEKRAPTFTGAKVYYDGKQCWQYKVVYDRPGCYCFQVPSNAICARTVIVGGGGKPKCISTTEPGGSTCSSAAGAGGAYSEKYHAVTAGSTYFVVCVGRQEQDSTVACNGSAVHTAGGAAGCIPGVATGGDWNSRGGCSGYTCNNCGGSLSHYCGSCKYICLTACCGYCIAYQYDPAGTGGSSCCNALLVGGASAGSPRTLCGGCSSIICGYFYTSVAGGGGSIGSQCLCTWFYNCCTCVCTAYCNGFSFSVNYPASAEGGHGTINAKPSGCRSFDGNCDGGVWRAGSGGSGGPERTSINGFQLEWGYHAICAYPYGAGFQIPEVVERQPGSSPCRVCWWDITDICGSGSPGTISELQGNVCSYCSGTAIGQRPDNAGEGAGTGGIMAYICNPCSFGNMISMHNGSCGPQLNWSRLCQLGLCGWCDQAWLPGMQDALFPFFITCAGTLGGSGGVGWLGYTSKAGKGGGGGQAKCQFLCVCWGGAFDCCNQIAATPLAFPPCLLDQLVSNAGTGMAIIYYREA